MIDQSLLETYLLEDVLIAQAKVINIAEAGAESLWTVALAVAGLIGSEELQTSLIAKKARKSLLKKLVKSHGPNAKSILPKKWVILDTIPTTGFGDVDEDALRQKLTGVTPRSVRVSAKEKRRHVAELSRKSASGLPDSSRPSKEIELVLSFLWAQILRLSPHEIRTSDSFLRLGGDSITAIELVSLAEDYGIFLTPASIMLSPQLDAMATEAELDQNSHTTAPEPFSLLPTHKDSILSEIQTMCGLTDDQTIEDAYPCTTLQEGLMALAMKQPGSYITRQVYRLPSHIDVARFKMAWERTIAICGCLRSRIALARNTTIQATINNDVAWENTEKESDIRSFVKKTRNIQMSYNTRLCRYGLVQERSGAFYFIWIIHHAVFDGLTARIILDTLHHSYHGSIAPPVWPYCGFIQYTKSLDHEAAGSYWRNQLQGAKQAIFPRIVRTPNSATTPNPQNPHKATSLLAGRVMKKRFPFPATIQLPTSRATVIRAAWALLLSSYCDSKDVCFGTTVSGRQAPIHGSSHMPGPMIATVPIRVRVDRDKRILGFLQEVHAHASEMVPYEQYGLQNISKLSEDARDICQFSNLLVIQPEKHLTSIFKDPAQEILGYGSEEQALSEESMHNYFNYPLVMQTWVSDDSIGLDVTYDSGMVDEAQVEAICHQFNHVIKQLIVPGDKLLSAISVSGPWDLQQFQLLNRDQPHIIESCFHHLFEDQAKVRPDATAICAWDFQFTYRELNQAADRLAVHLIKEHDVKTEDLIHVLFNKSAWYVVSILAINKAGGAWVPLDPSHPAQRLRSIATQTGARLTLVSSDTKAVFSTPNCKTVEIGPELDIILQKSEPRLERPESNVSPHNAAYVLFTSGSTGVPKGFVMEHRSVCTSQVAITKRLDFNSEVRILQFATFAFDLSVGEIVAPLISGACVCIPSEEIRMNGLTDYIRDTNINWAFLTPSFIRTISPADVPTLDLLVLAGEAVSRDILDLWFGKVRLFNGWGPAETCVFSTLHEWQSINESPLTIGKPVGGFCWIVDPQDPQKLAPTGTLGEVVIQGPTLLREYLHDSMRTEAAMVTSLPDWAPRREHHLWNQFYKSGDLCSYNSNGSIEFSSRKDTQVKIRGLRIELGEVAYNIREALQNVCQIAVDIFESDTGPTLIAYLCYNHDIATAATNAPETEDIFLQLSPELEEEFSAMSGQLSVTLPRYMIPTIFIPCRFMPFITSTKMDMKTLQLAASQLSQEQIANYSLISKNKRAPETEIEKRVQALWASLLKLPPASIGLDDSFLRIGGDSITAIHFISEARDAGIDITFKAIFDDPRLFAVATQAKEANIINDKVLHVSPYSLLDEDSYKCCAGNGLREECSLTSEQLVEDIMPCTKFQEGLMVLSVKQPGSYMGKYVYRLPNHVNIDGIKAAWEQTVALCGNLRTRIVLLKNGNTVQVVIKESVKWETKSRTLASVMAEVKRTDMTYGSPLSLFTLAQAENGDDYVVWTLHHAIFDGWTLRVMLQVLHDAYRGHQISKPIPYAHFVKFTLELDNDVVARYWRNELDNATKASFPRARATDTFCGVIRNFEKTIVLPGTSSSVITKATILRATWALLLARYCNADDVCFGTSVSGRQTPVPGLMNMPGPVVTTVPVRIRLDGEQTVSKYLQMVQSQATEMVSFEQYGLSNILKLGPDIKEACDFSSLFVIQPRTYLDSVNNQSGDSSDVLMVRDVTEGGSAEELMQGYFNYPLVIQGHMFDDSIELLLTYDSSILSGHTIEALSYQFDHVAKQLFKEDETPLKSISISGPQDLAQAMKWNFENSTELIDTCFHTLFERQANIRPDAPAIFAWDGKLSYGELNTMANRLAHHLVATGVKVGDFIPVCFEKSIWHMVSILAINKAGAAWVPLDHSHPIQRLQQVTGQTRAKIALASPSNTELCTKLVENVIQVSDRLDKSLAEGCSGQLGPSVNISARDAIYVLFTSGSTGTPKGLVMEHGSVCTSAIGIAKRLGLTPEVRMLQFAAFVFDLSIGEIIGPMVTGASIYMPSEEVRLNNLGKFIRDMHINWAYLTPSFVRTLKPEEVSSLELLLLAGEAVGRDLLDIWFGKLRLINGWGPAETCCFSTLHEWQSVSESPLTVGHPVGGYCWIVDPDNPGRLAPTGTIGEVVVQGPTLLREYLADPVRTASVATASPEWAPLYQSQHWGRSYRSGDLCSYNPDGTIEFAGRKDTQVKIRGLRVELGEVEHHIQLSLKGIRQIAVDVFKAENGSNLIAYFSFSDATKVTVNSSLQTAASLFLPMDESIQERLTTAVGELNVALPKYMIPVFFIPCRYMPTVTSTKLDRNELKRLVSTLSQPTLSSYSLSSGKKRAPETLMEVQLQKIWSDILSIPVDSIGKDDSFLSLGGDSITGIRLVNIARESGISLTVKDIFDDPRLLAVAKRAHRSEPKKLHSTLASFSLLKEPLRDLILGQDMRTQLSLPAAYSIEDAYPCTGFQEGLMALSAMQPGSHIAKYVYRLTKTIDIGRFKAAWERTFFLCANLRTRIVMIDGTCVQLLLNGPPNWSESPADLHTYIHSSQGLEMSYGSELSRYSLIEDEIQGAHFLWTIHHAIYDGWTTRIIMNVLHRVYFELEPPKLFNYSSFIHYTMSLDIEAAKSYWRSQLRDAKRASFPPLPGMSPAGVTKMVKRAISFPTTTNSMITTATILRATWALLLARYCDSDDVCFATTVSGRQAPVPGLMDMPGPAVATIPVRVRIDANQTVPDFLYSIQSQASEMVQYEQFGLPDIIKLSPDAKEACDFSSLLVIQPRAHLDSIDSIPQDSSEVTHADSTIAEDVSGTEMLQGYFTIPLVIQGHVFGNTIDLVLVYDSATISDTIIDGLSHQFDHVANQLFQGRDDPISSISVTSPWDLEQSRRWNSEDPEIVDSCIHKLIEQQAHLRPHAPAICAWDGELTYEQLNAKAERLAAHLVHIGVSLEDYVHVCFEKSVWFFVSILAINKAGAAWVPLDPSHPTQRLQQVVSQTGAKLALTSPSNASICAALVDWVIEVSSILDSELVQNPKVRVRALDRQISPQNAAYVLFTSGSTGTPKGLVMEHGAVCTSQIAIGKRLGLTPSTRMLQFASYVFDLSIGEIIAPLVSGACVCVPSEHTRLNGLKDFINENNCTWAFLTPSFVQTLVPSDIPGLELLLLAGEAVSRTTLETWHGKVRLINGWGPAETCVFSTLHEWKSTNESPLVIGEPVGSSCWIVSLDDPSSLAPIGTVGEIMIQGPTILREYLADPEKTAASTVTSLPKWIPRRESPGWGRLYKSGDLGCYTSDGKIQFCGRKDTQIKIRGLRVELGEVEHHIRNNLENVHHVAVDVLTISGGSSLVAYLCFSDELTSLPSNESAFLPMTEQFRDRIVALGSELDILLPRYMIPTIFIPCSRLPLITSTKLDRNRLRAMTTALDHGMLAAYSLIESKKQPPQTPMELKLRDIWAKVLNIDFEIIGRNDSFLRIGGDSIAAIQLVTLASQHNVNLTVAVIFRDPRLFAMAVEAEAGEEKYSFSGKPFALLPTDEIAKISSEVYKQCNLPANTVIEDLYPCSTIQQGYITSNAVTQPGSFISKRLYQLPKDIEPERFIKAWEKVLEICNILRTRIIIYSGRHYQAVIKDDVCWDTWKGKSVRDFMLSSREFDLAYGSRLSRYALIQEDGCYYFAWIVNHAIFDGYSVALMYDMLSRIYNGDHPALPAPYSRFIGYSLNQDVKRSASYWRRELCGTKRAIFPQHYSAASVGHRRENVTRMWDWDVAFPYSTGGSITKATIMRAAWAMTLARFNHTNDICFSETLSGRQSSVQDLDQILGPTTCRVPNRVCMDPQKSISSFLQEMQNRMAEMVPYEQFGPANIAKLGPDAEAACDCSSLLIIQPLKFIAGGFSSNLLSPSPSKFSSEEAIDGFYNYPLVLHVIISDDTVNLVFLYDHNVLAEREIESLAHQINHVAQQLRQMAESTAALESVTFVESNGSSH